MLDWTNVSDVESTVLLRSLTYRWSRSEPTRERVRGISGSSLIPGLGVKLSTIILAGPTILSRGRGVPSA